jgi:hypothetical protein
MTREEMMALAAKFDSVAHLLQPAVDRGYGGMTLDDYKEWVVLGDMQLWIGEGYAGVTEVVNYPRSRVVLVHLVGGKLEALLGDYDDLERFAEMVGATGIEIVGRRGWTKVLQDRGYTEAAVHLFKEVGHGQQA